MDSASIHGSELLAALQPADREAIAPHLHAVNLIAGATLYEPGDTVQHAYFPRHATLAAFLVVMEDGTAVESAMVGREGAIGGIISNGDSPAYARSVVLQGGDFYRVPSSIINQLKMTSPQFSHLMSRYADCLLAQIFQSVACNARHSIEQRSAKWLSSAVERGGGDVIHMTQAQLGLLLGVGRSYVTRVLSRFKERGIIATHRGSIRIADRTRLMETSCDCNRLVAGHFGTVLGGLYVDTD